MISNIGICPLIGYFLPLHTYIHIFKIVTTRLFHFLELFDKLFLPSIIRLVEYIHMYVFFLDSDNVFTSSTNSRSFNGITSKALTQSKIKALSNESDLYMYIHSTGMKRNAILSSTLTITQSRGNKDNDFRFKNGSTTFSGNIKNMNEETTESGSNSILILTISLNTFVILIICCIFVLCLFCKRKWIVQQIFENDEKGNLYDKKRPYAKRRIFQEPARLLYKHQDVDIEMTEMTASVGNFINGNPVTQSMPQEGHYSRDVYENDIDPYLAPPMTESVLENHQYLTVV